MLLPLLPEARRLDDLHYLAESHTHPDKKYGLPLIHASWGNPWNNIIAGVLLLTLWKLSLGFCLIQE